jgi:GNAT superfamily N-acetyltransferase
LALETEGRELSESLLRQGTQNLFEHSSYGFYVVAEIPHVVGQKVIGQLLVTYEWSDWRNGVFWWIQSVYIEKEWRQAKVFRRLFEYIRGEAKKRTDVVGLRLYVEKDNNDAKTVYEKLGLALTPYEMYEIDFILGSEKP